MRWSTCCRSWARDTITTVLPLPQDETLWESLHLVFATASGNVRRNRLSDFRNVRAAGLIAMKLDEGDHLIGVATCREGDDVLLATRKGRCIRFQLSDDTVRVFAGRDSSGVRGIKLQTGDEVISLSVLRHVDADHGGTRGLSSAGQRASAAATATTRRSADAGRGRRRGAERRRSMLTAERFAETGGRGGNAADRHRYRLRQALLGLRVPGDRPRRPGHREHHVGAAQRHERWSATFPVRQGDDVMMVTDAGRLIRVPADQVRITGRQAMGVTLFRVDRRRARDQRLPGAGGRHGRCRARYRPRKAVPTLATGDAPDEEATGNDETPPPEEGNDG